VSPPPIINIRRDQPTAHGTNVKYVGTRDRLSTGVIKDKVQYVCVCGAVQVCLL
jgi:hypothetical protein